MHMVGFTVPLEKLPQPPWTMMGQQQQQQAKPSLAEMRAGVIQSVGIFVAYVGILNAGQYDWLAVSVCADIW